VEGRDESDEMLVAGFRSINGEYFRAMRIPLVQGRDFDAHDNEGSLPVTIINEPGAGSTGLIRVRLASALSRVLRPGVKSLE